MSASSFNSIGNVLSTGFIIAIVVSSIGGLALCIGIIVVIVCLVKRSNRRRNLTATGMVLQPVQPYPYTWSNQYTPNAVINSNYPVAYPSAASPMTTFRQ